MPTAPPPLMGHPHFVHRTTPKSIFKRGRSSLVDIDAGLKEWPALSTGSAESRCQHLVKLLKAIRAWELKKGAKTSSTLTDRKAVVTELSNQTFQRLQYEDFERRKRGGAAQNLKSLAPGYTHERQVYLDSGKTFSPSGKTVHTIMSKPVNYNITTNKTFEQLNKTEFESYARNHGEETIEGAIEVQFMKKADRLKRLIFIEDGLFWEASNNGPPKKVQTLSGKGVFMYAMDEYGNLFGQDSQAAFEALKSKGGQPPKTFNHSSFNAGKDVICAGTLVIDNGKLKEVTNESGHYKPGVQDVLNLLNMFKSSRVDLAASVKVVILGATDRKTYNNAMVFLRNPATRPDKVE